MKKIFSFLKKNIHILLLTFPIWAFIMLLLITLVGYLFIYILGCTTNISGVATVSNCVGADLWGNMINSGWWVLVVFLYSPFVMLVGFLIWLYKIFMKNKQAN